MKKNTPNKNNLLFNQVLPLDFDDTSSRDLLELTDQQKCDKFLAKYMEIFTPIDAFPKYFQGSAKSIGLIYKEIKQNYMKVVLGNGWSEKKYVTILNDIFEHNKQLNLYVLDRLGLMYEKGLLTSQMRDRSGQ